MLSIYNSDMLLKISNMIDPFKKEWKNINNTNCYAYALGIDANPQDIGVDGFRPGFTTPYEETRLFSKDLLLKNIIEDLDHLGIDSRYVNQYYKLGKNEWKIAIFGGCRFSCGEFDDYHFLRQTEDGIWMHKQGYYGLPTNLDSKGKTILLPTTCNIDSECISYKYIMTLCLRK